MTTTERRPEVRFDLVTEPLFDICERPLYLTSTVRLGDLRRRVDDDFDVSDRGSLRADLDTVLEYPVLAGPVKVTPFAGLRYTWYEERLMERRHADRVGFTHGVTVTGQAWRVFDAQGGLFGLDGMRHVVLPEVTFRNIVGVDVTPDELVAFDEVESFDDQQMVEFRLRNLFQTVRHGRARTYVDEFIDLDTGIAFYPNAGRDNEGRPWGNLDVDLIVRFSENFQVATDFEWNGDGDGLEVFNVVAGYTPSQEFQAYAGLRHFEDTYDVVFVQLNWRPEEKWLTTLETSYDFEQDRGIDHRLTLSRIAEDWVLQLSFHADVGQNDYGISVGFSPRALFDPTLRPMVVGGGPRVM
jgi:hypothetical protein